MNHLTNVDFETAKFIELRRRILEAEPEVDEETLYDTLEGATNLREAIAGLVRSALEDQALIEALRSRLGDLKERLARIAQREEIKREWARAAMEESGLKKLLEPDCTISLRSTPPSLIITDEQAIPEWFWVPQPAKLDKRALLEVIKAGTGITGAELAAPRQSLSVRVR